jgi:hypothetical protein
MEEPKYPSTNHTVRDPPMEGKIPRGRRAENTTTKETEMAIPRGTEEAVSAAKEVPLVRAMKRRDTTMLEGRFVIRPPSRLPNFSPARVAKLIQTPAMRKERRVLDRIRGVSIGRLSQRFR